MRCTFASGGCMMRYALRAAALTVLLVPRDATAKLFSLRDAEEDCNYGTTVGRAATATGCGARYDSVELFESGNDGTLVDAVTVGNLDCSDLYDHPHSWTIDLGADDRVTAKRVGFYNGVEGRVTWFGRLVGEQGNAVLTWREDDPCDADAFLLTIQRPTEGQGSVRVEYESKPVRRGGGGGGKHGDNIVVVKLYREIKDETDGPDEHDHEHDRRHLVAIPAAGNVALEEDAAVAAAETEVDAADADVALLQRVLMDEELFSGVKNGDGDEAVSGLVTDATAADGGAPRDMERRRLRLERRLEDAGIQRLADGSVLMPSGRRLDSGSTLDVMVVYTAAAAAAMGGGGQAVSKLSAAVASGNAILASSNIALHLNLVYLGQTSYVEGARTFGDMLTDLKNGGVWTNDGSVGAVRNARGADLVQMIVNSNDYCGMGYLMKAAQASVGFADQAYTVVYQGCLNYHSQIHEWGHNMGANHDQDDAGDTGYADNFAQRYCESGGYRTVMSYSCTGASRVGFFSNPDISYDKRATGISGESNNARVVNVNKYFAANFRQSSGGGGPSPTPPAPKPTPRPTIIPPTPRPSSTPTGRPSPRPVSPRPTMHPSQKPTAPKPTPPPVPLQPYDAVTVSGSMQLTYRGCYRDMPAVRDINGAVFDFPGRNVLWLCAQRCHDLGYLVVGLQYGDECFCGDTFGAYSSLPASSCNMPCDGKRNRPCGGNNANSVFTIADIVNTPAPTALATPKPTAPGMAATPRPTVKPPQTSGGLGEGRYLGCYRDAVNMRDLDGPVFTVPDNTRARCNAKCQGFLFFGLQGGDQCYCGDGYGHHDEADMCLMLCPGDATQVCGGEKRSNVYAVTDGSDVSPWPDQMVDYIGCYRDVADARDLEGPSSVLYNASPRTCYAFCADRGFGYFGLQASNTCYCGNDAPTYGRADNCNMLCEGDPRATCGGTLASNIWRIIG